LYIKAETNSQLFWTIIIYPLPLYAVSI